MTSPAAQPRPAAPGAQVVVSATGLLATFNQAGVVLGADVHVAQTLGRLCREADEQVLLAVALAVRALRLGSVCLEVTGTAERVATEMLDPALDIAANSDVDVASLPWPEPGAWLERLRASTMVGQGADAPPNQRPVRLVEDLLYLERHWAQESVVRHELDQRGAHPTPKVDDQVLERTLDILFPGTGLAPGEADLQRLAAREAAHSWTSVLAGGPGTGKTTTVARLLAVLQSTSTSPLRIALAAPSGKAAARLEEAVTEALDRLPDGIDRPVIAQASTLHKLLDARGAGRGFGRTRHNPLPHQVVVVDEMSMVALPLMARLLEAVRPDTRLVLVGDPHQLTSVDAGAVLSDLVTARSPGRGPVTELTHTWRFGAEIAALAEAIRTGQAETALELLHTGGQVELVAADASALQLVDLPGLRAQAVAAGRAVHAAAQAGDAVTALDALDEHRLLCAHREGRWGVARWGQLVEAALHEEIDGYGDGGEWYVGRPLLVTRNLRDLDLSNGDAGIVVAHGAQVRAAIGAGGQPRLLSPFLLDAVTSLHAMTVHKAQGSQFRHVTVVLPPPESALLTRELLYTAVTRASQGVRLVGSAEAVAKAVNSPARRASGLARGW
ncbi:exodeoxyribonuclease V subunit alpha [Luteococcus sediminum]|uniref:exodeoxyribonuclease V subunit alpha n=1 Tax=Luteococcus sp. TaxID=1969402 RepID=UPI003736B2B8